MNKTIWMALIMLSGVVVSAAHPKFTQRELAYLPATAQIAMFKAGVITPTDVLEAQITRVKQYNGVYNTKRRDLGKGLKSFNAGKINAICFDRFAEARKAAKAATERYRNGTARRLEGVTVGVKNENNVVGWRVDMGSLILKDVPPCTDDCPLIERLKNEGAILVFSTTVPELYVSCMTWSRLYGVTRNPWNLAYGVGGSSGGSGAALAAGFCTIATGSDMGGSIRIPSSMNGVYGFKPPFGRVPTSEIAYETLGPLARTFDDLVLMQDIIAGPHPKNHASLRPKLDYPTQYQSLKGVKVAVCYFPKWLPGGCDKEVNQAMDKVAAALKKAGAEVKIIKSDWTVQGGKLSIFIKGLLSTEMYELIDLAADKQDLLCSNVKPFFKDIKAYSPKALIKATMMGGETHADVQKKVFCDDCIALVMPTLATPFVSPAFQATKDDGAVINGKTINSNEILLTPVWNLLNRYPVVDMPVMLSSKRVPIGVQIVGNTFDDLAAFRVAAGLSKVIPQMFTGDRFPDFREQK